MPKLIAPKLAAVKYAVLPNIELPRTDKPALIYTLPTIVDPFVDTGVYPRAVITSELSKYTKPVRPNTCTTGNAIAEFDTPVINPLALTVNVGAIVVPPNNPTFELTVSSVTTTFIAFEFVKVELPVKSPDMTIVVLDCVK